MNIWFDMASVISSVGADFSECGECGDCIRSEHKPRPREQFLRNATGNENSQGIRDMYRAWFSSQTQSGYPGLNDDAFYHISFKQTDSLYIQPQSHERWLVCNPTSLGHIAVVDQQAVALLERCCSPQTFFDLVQDFQNVSRSQLEEALTLFHALGFIQDSAHPLPPPSHRPSTTLSAWMHVTNACNLRCQYCYLDKTSEHMDTPTALRSVDAIVRSAQRHQYQHILLKYAGGEASLHLSGVLAIHEYALKQAEQQGITLSAYIMSNGVVLPQRVIQQLKLHRIGLMISLDGIGSTHDAQRPFRNGSGSFQYVDATITRLLASDVVPFVNVTVSQRNLDGLPALMEYLLERDLPFRLSYYRENDCSAAWNDLPFQNEQMIAGMRRAFAVIEQHVPQRRLIHSLIDLSDMTDTHEYTCGVGRNYLVIDQHGGIAKCHADIKRTITTIDAEDPLHLIQVDREGVRSVSVEDKEGCRTCEWRYWCTGGCPLVTYRATGSAERRSPNCSIYKALYPEALRLEGLRLLQYTSPITLSQTSDRQPGTPLVREMLRLISWVRIDISH